MRKPNFYLFTVTAFSALSVFAPAVNAQSASEQIRQAVAEGSANVSFRIRHEEVQQDNALEDAAATTMRTRMTLQTGSFHGFSALVEFDNVSAIGAKSYDSLVDDEYRGTYSVIADPVGSDLNQALIRYTLGETRALVFGTQRILHANQRFVGGVGFRQNEQTFDALSFTNRSVGLDIDYSYIWNVNRIFGSSKDSVQPTNLDSDSHILMATHKSDWGSLSGYVYALNLKNADALSSVTYGLTYAGTLGPVMLNASMATQSDYGDNPVAYDAQYLSLDAAVNAGPVKVLLGYELLGSDDGNKAFSTPLATLHKWQGWTDLFLSTPADGIEDTFLTVSGKAGAFSLSATVHDFSADEGGANYGTEWDLVGSYAFTSNISAELKYATYDSDSYAVDTDKIWLSLMLAF